MADLIRDAPLGQVIRFLTRNKVLKYPEEFPSFEVPRQYEVQLISEKPLPSGAPYEATSFDETSERDLEDLTMRRTKSRAETAPYSDERVQVEQQLAIQRTKSTPIVPSKTADGVVLVDWYTTMTQQTLRIGLVQRRPG